MNWIEILNGYIIYSKQQSASPTAKFATSSDSNYGYPATLNDDQDVMIMWMYVKMYKMAVRWQFDR